MRLLMTGGKALLVYPAGDADTVTILSMMPDAVSVRLPDGRTYWTVPEDIGIGVDDDIVPLWDDRRMLVTDDLPGTPIDVALRGTKWEGLL